MNGTDKQDRERKCRKAIHGDGNHIGPESGGDASLPSFPGDGAEQQ